MPATYLADFFPGLIRLAQNLNLLFSRKSVNLRCFAFAHIDPAFPQAACSRSKSLISTRAFCQEVAEAIQRWS